MVNAMDKRTVRVALLVNDTPVPPVLATHGTYHEIYKTHLQDSWKSFPDEDLRDSIGDLVVDGFDVVKGEYPEEGRLTGEAEGWRYDAVMMTGSGSGGLLRKSAVESMQRHTSDPYPASTSPIAKSDKQSDNSSSPASSAYDSHPWIARLIDFIRDLITDPRKRDLKVIGICFGMQILALAMGSQVAPNPAGWELGVYDVQLTETGRDLLKRIKNGRGKVGLVVEGEEKGQVDTSEVLNEQEVLSIQQVHRDQVTTLPQNTHLIGSTPKCQIQGFLRYSADSPEKIQILALQGHPEFVPDIVEKIIDVRAEKGVLDEATTMEARRRARGEMRGGLEGRGVVGWAVMQVLLSS